MIHNIIYVYIVVKQNVIILSKRIQNEIVFKFIWNIIINMFLLWKLKIVLCIVIDVRWKFRGLLRRWRSKGLEGVRLRKLGSCMIRLGKWQLRTYPKYTTVKKIQKQTKITSATKYQQNKQATQKKMASSKLKPI